MNHECGAYNGAMPSFIVTQPSWFSSRLELCENGQVIGELKMLKKMSYALAEATMPDGTARFGYTGWMAGYVSISSRLSNSFFRSTPHR